MRRYIIWRDLPLTAKASFGISFRGAFPDLIHAYLYFFGVWEPGISRVFRWHLRQGDRVIDIGANIGAHTALAAVIVGPAGRIHAIEASPNIFSQLKRNLDANWLAQVIPYNVAASDVAGPVTVYLNDADNLGKTTILRHVADHQRTTQETQVSGLPLADIVPHEDLKNARLIKVDVEGAEWLVLQGMRDVIASIPPDCIVLVEAGSESLSHFGASFTALINLFRESGHLPVYIANSYNPDFYIRTPARVLSTILPLDVPMLDLVFAMPEVIEQLLAKDLGDRSSS